MRVKPLAFALFLLWVVITITVLITQESLSWWLCALLTGSRAFDNFMDSIEDS